MRVALTTESGGPLLSWRCHLWDSRAVVDVWPLVERQGPMAASSLIIDSPPSARTPWLQRPTARHPRLAQGIALNGALADNVRLVTGAGSGIGRPMAKGFAEAGAQVVGGDINLAGAEKTGAEVTGMADDVGSIDEKGLAGVQPVPALQQHWAQPEQLVGITLFRASDAASFTNGAIIPVDGGWSAGRTPLRLRR